jgi:hypothetical protein
MKLVAILFFALILCAGVVAAQSPNVSGDWDVTLTSPQGTFNIKLNLKQDGEKLTGTVKGDDAAIPVEGTIKGKDVTLKYSITFQGNNLPITLTASADDKSMKGTADYGGFAQGEYTATRPAQASAATAAAPAKPADSTAAAPAANITGAWAFQVQSSNGTGTPTFTFKQDGEKLTGQYKGAFGEAPVAGTVKDNKIEFTLKIDAQGQAMTIKYAGTVEKDGTMKGTAEVGELGSATWTAKRQ